MTKLSPINFTIGLSTSLNVNRGQIKFKDDISKNVAEIANIWPKIGQLPLWRATFYWAKPGHFSSEFEIICFPNKSNGDKNKALSLLVEILFFLPHFLLQGLTWTILQAWTQNNPQNFETCTSLQLLAQIMLFKMIGLNLPLNTGYRYARAFYS